MMKTEWTDTSEVRTNRNMTSEKMINYSRRRNQKNVTKQLRAAHFDKHLDRSGRGKGETQQLSFFKKKNHNGGALQAGGGRQHLPPHTNLHPHPQDTAER